MASGGAVLGLTTIDGRRPRVAVVGGTPASATVAGVLIEQFGCVPINSRTGADILRLIGASNAFDLVVMDFVLPDMEALAVVEHIRALGLAGATPMVALTDDRTELASPRGRAAGFAATVRKPYSPRELYGAMHVALRGPQTAVRAPPEARYPIPAERSRPRAALNSAPKISDTATT